MEQLGAGYVVYGDDVETLAFDWGNIKFFSDPEVTDAQRMIDDEPAVAVRPGASIYIPQGVYRSTVNTGWEPLRLLIVYTPPGPEQVLRELPGCEVVPAGQLPG